MRKFLLLSVIFFAALYCGTSCEVERDIYKDWDELGAVDTLVTVTAAAGTVEIQIYANKKGRASTEASWLTIQNPDFEADQKIRIDYEANPDTTDRSTTIQLKTETRSESVIFTQKH